jgi:hypothetical protein
MDISDAQSFVDSVTALVKTLGLFAIAVVLLVGAIFFLPTFVASMRNASLKGLICVLNVVSLTCLVFQPLITVAIWMILMIAAVVGRRKIAKTALPNITIVSNRDVNRK